LSDLAAKECVPCKGGVAPLHGAALLVLQHQLGPDGNGWTIEREHHLEKEFRFPDFVTALAYVNRVGALAEAQNHHPDIALAWGRVRVTIWTHKIDGLTESDFVFAAKCDALAAIGR
jgi:4a-hydroxytetrahydrobiopterin dehydratase